MKVRIFAAIIAVLVFGIASAHQRSRRLWRRTLSLSKDVNGSSLLMPSPASPLSSSADLSSLKASSGQTIRQQATLHRPVNRRRAMAARIKPVPHEVVPFAKPLPNFPANNVWVKVFGEANPNKTKEKLLDGEAHTEILHVVTRTTPTVPVELAENPRGLSWSGYAPPAEVEEMTKTETGLNTEAPVEFPPEMVNPYGGPVVTEIERPKSTSVATGSAVGSAPTTGKEAGQASTVRATVAPSEGATRPSKRTTESRVTATGSSKGATETTTESRKGTIVPSEGTTGPSEGFTESKVGTTKPGEGVTEASTQFREGITGLKVEVAEGTTRPSGSTTESKEGTAGPSEGVTGPSEGTVESREGVTLASEGMTEIREVSTSISEGVTEASTESRVSATGPSEGITESRESTTGPREEVTEGATKLSEGITESREGATGPSEGVTGPGEEVTTASEGAGKESTTPFEETETLVTGRGSTSGPSEAATEATEGATGPSEAATEATEGATGPSEEATEATEGVTGPGGETTEATEGATGPGGETTVATEGATGPGGETTEATEGVTGPSYQRPSIGAHEEAKTVSTTESEGTTSGTRTSIGTTLVYRGEEAGAVSTPASEKLGTQREEEARTPATEGTSTEGASTGTLGTRTIEAKTTEEVTKSFTTEEATKVQKEPVSKVTGPEDFGYGGGPEITEEHRGPATGSGIGLPAMSEASWPSAAPSEELGSTVGTVEEETTAAITTSKSNATGYGTGPTPPAAETAIISSEKPKPSSERAPIPQETTAESTIPGSTPKGTTAIVEETSSSGSAAPEVQTTPRIGESTTLPAASELPSSLASGAPQASEGTEASAVSEITPTVAEKLEELESTSSLPVLGSSSTVGTGLPGLSRTSAKMLEKSIEEATLAKGATEGATSSVPPEEAKKETGKPEGSIATGLPSLREGESRTARPTTPELGGEGAEAPNEGLAGYGGVPETVTEAVTPRGGISEVVTEIPGSSKVKEIGPSEGLTTFTAGTTTEPGEEKTKPSEEPKGEVPSTTTGATESRESTATPESGEEAATPIVGEIVTGETFGKSESREGTEGGLAGYGEAEPSGLAESSEGTTTSVEGLGSSEAPTTGLAEASKETTGVPWSSEGIMVTTEGIMGSSESQATSSEMIRQTTIVESLETTEGSQAVTGRSEELTETGEITTTSVSHESFAGYGEEITTPESAESIATAKQAISEETVVPSEQPTGYSTEASILRESAEGATESSEVSKEATTGTEETAASTVGTGRISYGEVETTESSKPGTTIHEWTTTEQENTVELAKPTSRGVETTESTERATGLSEVAEEITTGARETASTTTTERISYGVPTTELHKASELVSAPHEKVTTHREKTSELETTSMSASSKWAKAPGGRLMTTGRVVEETESTSTAQTEPMNVPAGPEDFGYGGGNEEITEARAGTSSSSTSSTSIGTSATSGPSEKPTGVAKFTKISEEVTTPSTTESSEEGVTEGEKAGEATEGITSVSTEVPVKQGVTEEREETSESLISEVTTEVSGSSEGVMATLEVGESSTGLSVYETETKEETASPAKSIEVAPGHLGSAENVSGEVTTSESIKETTLGEIATGLPGLAKEGTITGLETIEGKEFTETTEKTTSAVQTEPLNKLTGPEDFGYGGGNEEATESRPSAQPKTAEAATVIPEAESGKRLPMTEATTESGLQPSVGTSSSEEKERKITEFPESTIYWTNVESTSATASESTEVETGSKEHTEQAVTAKSTESSVAEGETASYGASEETSEAALETTLAVKAAPFGSTPAIERASVPEGTGKTATTESSLAKTTKESGKSTWMAEGQKPEFPVGKGSTHVGATVTAPSSAEEHVSSTGTGFQPESTEASGKVSTYLTGQEDFGYGGGNEVTVASSVMVVEGSTTARSELSLSTEHTNLIETSIVSESAPSASVEYTITPEASIAAESSASAEYTITPEASTISEYPESQSTSREESSAAEPARGSTPFTVTPELSTRLGGGFTAVSGQEEELIGPSVQETETHGENIPANIPTGPEDFGYGGGPTEPSITASASSSPVFGGSFISEGSSLPGIKGTIGSQLSGRQMAVVSDTEARTGELPELRRPKKVFSNLPLKKIDDSTKRKWQPYVLDCNVENDEKGTLCREWAKGGLCESHRPTMFLFCRRTCLCVGPPMDLRRLRRGL